MRGTGFGSAGPERRSDNGMAAQVTEWNDGLLNRLAIPGDGTLLK